MGSLGWVRKSGSSLNSVLENGVLIRHEGAAGMCVLRVRPLYSALKASTGFTLRARHAGRRQAPNATTRNTPVTPT